MNLSKLLCCYWCYSIPDLINVSHVRRETHSQLHSKHLKYGFKLREAKKVKYSAGMKTTLMNDGSNAVSLCEAAAICQTLFHVLFTRFIFIYLWHRHSSLMCSEYDVYGISAAHVGAGRELGLSQLWAIVSPLAEPTSRPWMELAGNWDKWFRAELDRSGSARLRRTYLWVGGCGDAIRLRDPPAAAVHIAAEGRGGGP